MTADCFYYELTHRSTGSWGDFSRWRVLSWSEFFFFCADREFPGLPKSFLQFTTQHLVALLVIDREKLSTRNNTIFYQQCHNMSRKDLVLELMPTNVSAIRAKANGSPLCPQTTEAGNRLGIIIILIAFIIIVTSSSSSSSSYKSKLVFANDGGRQPHLFAAIHPILEKILRFILFLFIHFIVTKTCPVEYWT